MGSSGSGTFSDYPQQKPTSPKEKNGGSSGLDKCGTAFSTMLEEVSRCSYYLKTGLVPPVGTKVNVSFNGFRLVAVTYAGEEVGYFPTMFNYLKACLDDNFAYNGAVSSSKTLPSPSVTVDIVPV